VPEEDVFRQKRIPTTSVIGVVPVMIKITPVIEQARKDRYANKMYITMSLQPILE
jgi:hypothetical protein